MRGGYQQSTVGGVGDCSNILTCSMMGVALFKFKFCLNNVKHEGTKFSRERMCFA